jgi:hypothetical protein
MLRLYLPPNALLPLGLLLKVAVRLITNLEGGR